MTVLKGCPLSLGSPQGPSFRLHVWELPWTALTNNPEDFSYLILAFLLRGLWLFEGVLSARMRRVHLNYISTLIYRIMLVGFL